MILIKLVTDVIIYLVVDCSVNVDQKDLKVLGHRDNLALSNVQENGVQMTVTKMNVHPKYDDEKVINDVAVWELSGGDSLKQFIKLNSKDDLSDIASATALGWGTISNEGPLSKTLQTVNLPLVDLATCSKQLDENLPATNFCAGGEGGKDTCSGDSGGALFIENAGVHIMLGLTSWGDECALKGKPGVYTRISSFKSWIESFIKPTTTASNIVSQSLLPSVQIVALAPPKPSPSPSNGFFIQLGSRVSKICNTGEWVTGISTGKGKDINIKCGNDDKESDGFRQVRLREDKVCFLDFASGGDTEICLPSSKAGQNFASITDSNIKRRCRLSGIALDYDKTNGTIITDRLALQWCNGVLAQVSTVPRAGTILNSVDLKCDAGKWITDIQANANSTPQVSCGADQKQNDGFRQVRFKDDVICFSRFITGAKQKCYPRIQKALTSQNLKDLDSERLCRLSAMSLVYEKSSGRFDVDPASLEWCNDKN